MNSVKYKVPAISCGHCVMTIKNEVGDLPGVIRVDADQNTKLVEVDYDDSVNEQQILDLLEEINYPAEKN